MGRYIPQSWFSVLAQTNRLKTLVHSVKVGLALTLASLLVLVNHPYTWIGHNAIWAVLSVVVVFETSAGATLSKGLNRGIGTVLAGFLALGAAHLADLCREPGEPIFIGCMVFLAGMASTFIRAIPPIKKKFDYGVVIFMMTFCMILVTGYRVGDEIRTASDRLLTIMIGGLICLIVSSFIIPHWAGEDLHRLSADNFDKLGTALEECVRKYLNAEEQPITSKMIVSQSEVDSIYEACRKSVNARSTEEALAIFASWEPPHGKFKLGYPWKQYLIVGAVLRHCAYSVLALHGCLQSEIRAPRALRELFANELLNASSEGAAILHELGECIRNMRKPKGSPIGLLQNVTSAANAIKCSISKHSYLLATPESWMHVEDKQQRIRNLSLMPSVPDLLPSNLRKSASHIHTRQQYMRSTKSKISIQVHPLIEGTNPQVFQDFTLVKLADYGQEGLQLKNAETNTKTKFKAKSNPNPFTGEEIASKEHTIANQDDSLRHTQHRASSSNHHVCMKSDIGHCHSIDNKSSLNLIKSSHQGDDIACALSLVTFASLLVESLARLKHVVDAVDCLGKLGRFTPCCGTQRVHVEPEDLNVQVIVGQNEIGSQQSVGESPSNTSK